MRPHCMRRVFFSDIFRRKFLNFLFANMEGMTEVLFTTDKNEHQLSCSAWDFRTGTNLMTYKGGGCAQQRSLCFLRSEFVISANSTKPLIHVWPVNSQDQISSVRFVSPGKPDTLALSPDGNFLVAGILETIYLWHLPTGRMLNTISKHYQTVNCIKFTDDGSHFVSAGQDGGVVVWNLTQVVTRSDENQTPHYSFNDHGLPVTDVFVGAGGIRAYMTTVSLDRTCKVYDLSSGSLLLNVVFTEGLHCVVENTLETSVYVGATDGSIYEFNINSIPRTKEYHIVKDHSNKFMGHQGAVTCLALSLDGHTLLSGGLDNKVCIWHILSKQLIKTLPHKGAITNIALRLTTSVLFNPEHKQPHIFINNLKRMIDPPDADDDEVVEIFITEQDTADELENNRVSSSLINFSHGLQTEHSLDDASADEITKLRDEVRKLQRINKKLFEVSTKNLLKNKK